MKTLVFALLLALQNDAPPAVVRLMERLKLTAEQAEKVEPVLMEQAKQLQALRAQVGDVKSASMGTKLKMRKDAQAIDAKADGQLKSILTVDQMKLLLDIRKERRAKL